MRKEQDYVSPPRWISIQLLEKCNLRCKMCYEWGSNGSYLNNKEQAILSFEVIKNLIEECKPFKPHYEFFGGEPLLHPNLWDIITLIKETGSTVDFPTNGTLVKKNAELLAKHKPDRIWFSLDGPEHINDLQRGKGVYKKVVEGINELNYFRKLNNTRYPKLGVQIVITHENYNHLEDLFINHLDVNKLDCICIAFQSFITEEGYLQYKNLLKNNFNVDKTDSAKSFLQDIGKFVSMDFDLLYNQIQSIKKLCVQKNIEFFSYPRTTDIKSIKAYFSGKWEEIADYHKRCIFPYFYVEVSAKGEVTLCHTFYDYTFGNIHENSLLDIWHSEKVKEFRANVRKNILPICPACCYYYTKENSL